MVTRVIVCDKLSKDEDKSSTNNEKLPLTLTILQPLDKYQSMVSIML